MILRLLFVALSALNIAVAAWVWLGQPYAARARPATDPGVPELQLLTDLPAAASSVVLTAGTDSTTTYQRCLALGPFPSPQDLRRTRQALARVALRMRFRQEQVAQPSVWWVYLPPGATRTQALATARQLDTRHIVDYFVVSAGEQPNAISLGVFRDADNARRRRDAIIAAGFPARMTERVRTGPQYWLDIVLPAGKPLDLARLGADAVRSHTTGCF